METTSPSSPLSAIAVAAHLRLVVTRTARRLRQEANGGIGPSMSAALVTIARFGPLTPSELATREGIQRPSATRVVGRLEEEGLIVREQDPADRRSSRVRVTETGTAFIEEVRSRKDAYLAQRIARLGEPDRRTLERAAVLLEQLLELDRDPEPGARPGAEPHVPTARESAVPLTRDAAPTSPEVRR